MSENKGFTIIQNEIINSGKVSLKAMGLFLYLKSKPKDWRFSTLRIKNEVKDGLASIRSAMQELEAVGLVKRLKTKNEKGQFEINYIFDETVSENPTTEKPTTEIKKPSNRVRKSADGKTNNGKTEIGNPNNKKNNEEVKNYSPEDLDRIKIEDGVRIHEETKVALDIYARDTKTQVVKPFVLIVAKDTDHSRTILEMIKSKSFFDGYYADKVIEVHSNQRGEEKDENIAQLLTLEDPDNKTEIVIHVNMLKEGWDVTNLYTIVPLRTAASVTLREQTIGRGLRLPFGKRVGISKVDTLTIVAHDKFQEIVDEANKPDSIIRKENIITIDETELSKPKEVVSSQTSLNSKYEARVTAVSSMADDSERTKEIEAIKAEKSILELFVNEAKSIKNIEELKSEDVKKTVLANVAREINEKTLFAEEIMEAVVKRYEELADEFIAAVIAIPQISIIQSGEAKSHFESFDLDVKNLNLQPLS